MSLLRSLGSVVGRINVRRSQLDLFQNPSVLPYIRPNAFFATTSSNGNTKSSADDDDDSGAAEQHKAWVKFQQSIAVKGFETGQTTTIQVGSKSSKAKRGRATKRKINEAQAKILERQRLVGTGGGEYPPMRYSEEETERLLAEAYAAIPQGTGKRGSRNKKRQERRWQLVREIRAKQKAHLAAFQVRKMAKRSQKIKEVKAILQEAPQVRQRDRLYQLAVYQRWASTMGIGPFAPKMLQSGVESAPSS